MGLDYESLKKYLGDIRIIPLIIGHVLFGTGIAMIGMATGDKIDFYGGITFVLIFIPIATYLDLFRHIYPGLYGILSLVSCIYILLRLCEIYINKKCKIKII